RQRFQPRKYHPTWMRKPLTGDKDSLRGLGKSQSSRFFGALETETSIPVLPGGSFRVAAGPRGSRKWLTISIFLLLWNHGSQALSPPDRPLCPHAVGHGHRSPTSHHATAALRPSAGHGRGRHPVGTRYSRFHALPSPGETQERGFGHRSPGTAVSLVCGQRRGTA